MEPTDALYQLIQGRLLHVTSPTGYAGIVADGWIRPNDGSRPYTYRDLGVCHALGAVALLDLSPGRWPLFGPEALGMWASLLTRHEPMTFVLDIERQWLRIHGKLARYEDVAELTRPPWNRQMLPDTEVCFLGSIPAGAIRRGIVVDHWDSGHFRVFDGFPAPSGALEEFQRELFTARGVPP